MLLNGEAAGDYVVIDSGIPKYLQSISSSIPTISGCDPESRPHAANPHCRRPSKSSSQHYTALFESGFDVTPAATLQFATNEFSSDIDLVILDLMLPDGNGLDWLSKLRAAGHTVSVLVLTAKDSIRDRVDGLDSGADDYLIKPFAIDELLARVRALLRRETRSDSSSLAVADLQIDLARGKSSEGMT